MAIQAKIAPRDLFAKMNGTEKAFAQILEAKKRNGVIAEWFYEGVTLKLGDDCRLTMDFLIVHNDGLIEFAETKGGFIREDAMLKLRVCAKMFPFKITIHQLIKGVWAERGM